MSERGRKRPWGVTALAVFFSLGSGVSAVSCASLLAPGGPLEPMWRLNPRGREGLGRMGPTGPALMAIVSLACGIAAVGLWSGKRWGHRAAVALLVVNLAGDIANVVLGVEPRAIVGVPVVAGLLVFLASNRVRSYFRRAVPL